ncbi:MAG: hypothetical protein ACR2JF_00985 [Iamia sp.]
MFTTGSKWFFGVAAVALVGALVYGGATNPSDVGMDTLTGVLTLGYKGGVGDQFGYVVLMGIAGASAFLGATTAAFRDASIEAEAALLGRDTVPDLTAPAQGSYWPVVGAFGAASVVIGLVTTQLLVILGVVVLLAVTFEWGISAWAEKATNDPSANQVIRRQVMMPIEVPVLGALGIAVFVLAVSRMLLALPELGVYLLFALVPITVMVVAFVLSARPRINRSVVAGLCVVGALGILAGGVVSAVVGPRDIEEHEEEEHEGAPLLAPDAPVTVTDPGSPR